MQFMKGKGRTRIGSTKLQKSASLTRSRNGESRGGRFKPPNIGSCEGVFVS